jgi:hypothetical protein
MYAKAPADRVKSKARSILGTVEVPPKSTPAVNPQLVLAQAPVASGSSQLDALSKVAVCMYAPTVFAPAVPPAVVSTYSDEYAQ